MMSAIKQSVTFIFNSPAKGGSFWQAEKNERFIARRPPPFGRRAVERVGAPACVAPFQRTLAPLVGQKMCKNSREALKFRAKNLWRLASRTFKMSPNFVVEPLPIGKLRFLCGFLPRNLQLASHFLAGELKVRLREAQSSAAMVKLLYHCAEQPIFCFACLSGQLPNFHKESDNFFALSLLNIFQKWERAICPKAIITQCL